MFKNNFKLLILFLLWIHAFSGYGQATLPKDVSDNIKLRIDNELTPGIVVGVLDGKEVTYYSFGVKSLTTKEVVDEHTVFEIGSITKTFTGIILADMSLKGEVKLDDPIQQYLPQGVTAPVRNGAAIKLVNLANHTSSLPRLPGNFSPANPNNPYADYSEKQLYDFLTSYTLPRDIGSQYEYSNYAVGMLGNLLAAKKAMSYEQLMINTIAKPLDLGNTRITLTPEMKKNLALGYAGGALMENWDLPTLAGAGAIRSTAKDMMRYVQANMGIVKTNLYSAMQLAQKNSREEGAKPMVGLGWHTIKEGDNEIICHSGGTGGYRTFIGFIKNSNKAIVVMSNSTVNIDDIGIHFLNPSKPLAIFKPYELAKSVPVDAAVLEKYVGQYVFMPGMVLTITRDGNQLSAQLSNQPAFPVFAKSETEFFYKVVDAQLTFTQNGEGVTLHQAGQNLIGKKQVK